MNTINILGATVITVDQFIEMVKDFTLSRAVSLSYVVDDSRSRTIKGEKQVQKLVKVRNAYLNHKYEQKVINLTGNSDFKAEEMKGKTRISGTLIKSDKTGEILLDLKILKTEAVEVLGYYHNGKQITEAEAVALDLWAAAYYNPAPKKTSGRGTVAAENDFRMITIGIKKIAEIKFEGESYLFA
jgi:hypothetical protein